MMRREAGPNRLPQEARSTTPNTSAKALPMTDLDALARDLAIDVTGTHLDWQLPKILRALHKAHTAGRTEGFAAGAQAMRERAALTVLASSIDGVASGRLAAAIRAIPLPDEKEKP